jgi:hypothetical protein
MAIKIRNTADDSLGAVSIGDGKSLKIWVENGKRIVEMVEDTVEDVLDIMPQVENIWGEIKRLFENIWNGRFPCVIRVDGLDYVYTQQTAPWKGIDKVMYLYLSPDSETGLSQNVYHVLFCHENPSLQEAKNALYREIKAAGYTK